MFNIVLVHPEIPHNTGAAGRLSLATGSTLHLVEPLGFSLEEKHIRRVGLDYWKDVDLKVWTSWEALSAEIDESQKTPHFCTTKTERGLWDVTFEKGDWLIFGCETKGLPAKIREQNAPHLLRIPMLADSTRSLNLSTAIAIVLYEAERQIHEIPRPDF